MAQERMNLREVERDIKDLSLSIIIFFFQKLFSRIIIGEHWKRHLKSETHF